MNELSSLQTEPVQIRYDEACPWTPPNMAEPSWFCKWYRHHFFWPFVISCVAWAHFCSEIVTILARYVTPFGERSSILTFQFIFNLLCFTAFSIWYRSMSSISPSVIVINFKRPFGLLFLAVVFYCLLLVLDFLFILFSNSEDLAEIKIASLQFGLDLFGYAFQISFFATSPWHRPSRSEKKAPVRYPQIEAHVASHKSNLDFYVVLSILQGVSGLLQLTFTITVLYTVIERQTAQNFDSLYLSWIIESVLCIQLTQLSFQRQRILLLPTDQMTVAFWKYDSVQTMKDEYQGRLHAVSPEHEQHLFDKSLPTESEYCVRVLAQLDSCHNHSGKPSVQFIQELHQHFRCEQTETTDWAGFIMIQYEGKSQ